MELSREMEKKLIYKKGNFLKCKTECLEFGDDFTYLNTLSTYLKSDTEYYTKN